MDQLQSLNQELIDKAPLIRNDTELIIDIDSTHSDTFGHQEQTYYNAHYQTYEYHPSVAFDGFTGDFLKAELRSGNQDTSKGIKAFINPLLYHYTQSLLNSNILVRGDSGFAIPEVYESCEANDSQYVIRLNNNWKLSQLAEKSVLYGDNQKWEEREVQYFSVSGNEMSSSYIFQSPYAEDNKWSITYTDEIDLSSEEFIGYLTPSIFINLSLYQKEAKFYQHNIYGIITNHNVFSNDNFDQYDYYNVFNSSDFQSYNGEFFFD